MGTKKKPLEIFSCFVLGAVLLIGGNALGQSSWVEEIGNSITMYQSLYPGSNFKPYEDQLTRVKDALHQNDKKAVTTEMGKWFKMLRNRAHGIDDMAASELMNFAVMVTPVQEYNISVPAR
jgi:hypothetical protein